MESRLARSIDWPTRPGHIGVVVRISVSLLFCTASVVLVDLLVGAALGETGSEYEHVPRVWALAGAVMGIVRATSNEMVGRRSEGPLAALGLSVLAGVAIALSSATDSTGPVGPLRALAVIGASAVLGVLAAAVGARVVTRQEPPPSTSDVGSAVAAGIVLLLVGVVVLPAITDPSTEWQASWVLVAIYLIAVFATIPAAMRIADLRVLGMQSRSLEITSVAVPALLGLAMIIASLNPAT